MPWRRMALIGCAVALASACGSNGGMDVSSNDAQTSGASTGASATAEGGTASSSGNGDASSTSGETSADSASDAWAGEAASGLNDSAAGSLDAEALDANSSADTRLDVTGDGPSGARQIQRPAGTTGAALGYYEYLPPGYGDAAARPVLFFFHGVGENGNGSTDLSKVLTHGPPQLISVNQWPASRPFIVLSPQHPPVKGAPDPIYKGFDCWTPAEIHDFIAFGIANYAVDMHRIYLTALSCGAMGSENYFKQFGTAQNVAASALISGNATIAWQGQGCALVQKMGLWAFHGDADTVVPIMGDNTAMPEFMACPMPRKDVRYTVYPGVGHDAWTQTYDLGSGNDIYNWLLGFIR
jgi:predicted esterase